MRLHDDGSIIPQATKDILSKIANKIIKIQFSDILKLSAPAFVHCPKTYLDCAALDLTFSSRYLTQAAETSDPIMRLKLITCMYVGGHYLSPEYA